MPNSNLPKLPKLRDGVVVSTVIRLTTSDGRAFDDPAKAIEHEAFYQILKLLVKQQGWADSDETAAFALALARCYRNLLPLLHELEREAAALEIRVREHQRPRD